MMRWGAFGVALLVLLTACGPGPTTVVVPTVPGETTVTPRLVVPSTRGPSVTPWPTRSTRRPSYTPLPLPTRPTSTPGPTCLPELGMWLETWGLWSELDPLTFVPILELKDEQRFQDYTVRIYEAWGDCCCGASLEILKNGRRIYAARGYLRFWAGFWWDGKSGVERQIPLGQDITGDGIPDLLITQWSGGAHCCITYHVFQLGEEFRLLGIIDAGDYDSRIADLDGDGNWEFTVHDWVILPCTWWACCCGPDPYVILHYEDGGFHLAEELMRGPAPTAEELQTWAQESRELEFRTPEGDAEFWDTVMDLIYTGHADLVEPFLEMVWPDDPLRRGEFLHGLLQTLSESLYWPEIKAVSPTWPWPEE